MDKQMLEYEYDVYMYICIYQYNVICYLKIIVDLMQDLYIVCKSMYSIV